MPTDKSVTFPAALTSFSDGTAASFSSETYYGRMDPSPIYSNTTRTITLGFDVISYSEAEAKTQPKTNEFVTIIYVPGVP